MHYDITYPSPVSCLIRLRLSQEDIAEGSVDSDQDKLSALEKAADNALNRILSKEQFRPLSSPVLRVEDESQGRVSCLFEVLPPIPLPEALSKLELHFPKETSSTVLQDAVNSLLSQYAKLVQVSERRTPQPGDIVLADIQGCYYGKKVPGMCVKSQKFRIVDKDRLELISLLCSLFPGEKGQMRITCPEGYPDPFMRGKEIELTVCLRHIYIENRPAFNEAFAARLGFKSLDTLKQALYEHAARKQMLKLQTQARREMLDRIVGTLDFPVPSSLVVRALRQRMSEARKFFENGGTPAEEMECILKRMQDESLADARAEAKIQAFLLALAKRENLHITSNELEAEIHHLSKIQNVSFENMRHTLWENGAVNDIMDILLARHALEFMAKQAKLVKD